jgi:hypothetical protein
MYITHHQYHEKTFASTMCNHLTDAGTLLSQMLISEVSFKFHAHHNNHQS